MIVFFHCLSLLVFQLLRHRKRMKFLESLQKVSEKSVPVNNTVMDLENNLKFEPPVFRQRYGKVYEILLDERWRKKVKKLCDFGCAEFGLFVFIKRLSSLNQILCIDIEEDTLRDNVRRIYPLTLEYLKRRESPLEITVFAGSVADPDYRLQCTDAVVAVELIEHLYPDVLDAFPYNVFSFIEPKIVIITTPNSDFNILFSSDPKRMRHYDHKFEWSRAQFEEWATNIVCRFPDYTVSFSGIGAGPPGTEHLGECSQMAVFIRKDLLDDSFISKSYSSPCHCDSVSLCRQPNETAKMSCSCVCTLCCPNSSYGVCTYYSFSKQISNFEIPDNEEANPSYGIHYKFIKKVDYPFHFDDRTEEQKMMDEFRYRINNFGQASGRFFVEERNRSEIPLTDLIYGPDSCFITESELSKLLTKHDYKIEECIIQETGQSENCVVYEPVMDRYSNSSEASGYDADYPIFEAKEGSVLDWDSWDEPYVEESRENYCSSTGNSHNALEVIRSDDENENMESNEDTFILQPVRNINRYNENPQVVAGPPILFIERDSEENAETSQQQLENQVAHASREALFDPNSVQDLLEDFEIPPPIQEAVDILDLGNNVVLLGIRSIANGIDQQVLSVENGFPNWLLQILGTQVAQDGSVTSTSSEEPHYYCQGDGLGVHPSVMAVEVEDEEEDETTSSSNNTADYAEVDQGVSSQDMSSLPEDSQANTENQDFPEETDDGLRNETSEQTEYFDTISSSSDTGIDTEVDTSKST